MDKKSLSLQTVHESFRIEKCNALPGLHALSGADVTGSFSGKGKRTWWNAFEKANTDVLLALGRLGHTETLEEETFLQIEQFVCQVYRNYVG